MITFPAAVGNAIRSVQCALLNDNEYVWGSLSRFAGPLRQRGLDGINATRGLLGCPVTPPIPPPPSQFEGGQCPITYFVNGTLTNFASDGSVDSSGPFQVSAVGPIGGLSFGSSCVANPTGPLAPGAQAFCAFLSAANGVQLVAGNGNGGITAAITSVVPAGPQPDNCGDPPPFYPPPVPVEIDIDVTYNTDEGDEVTVNIPFVFAPITVDFNGNFRIPVTFDFGGNEFSANFPLNVSIPITVNFPGLNPGDGQGVEDLPPDEPGTTVPPVPPDQKVIGVVVNILSFDSRKVSSYDSPGIPRLLVPRVGSVKFAYSIGAATFWSPDIDIKGDREFIPCPFSQGADLVVASPQIGVDLSFVPIRGFPLATVADIPAPA